MMPYIKLGVGGLVYSARSYKADNEFMTERADEPVRSYPAVALLVPIGGGIAFRYNSRISIQPELTYHFTSTDALDDMGTLTGGKGGNDAYGIASIKMQYAF
jgi:hypothetical protein